MREAFCKICGEYFTSEVRNEQYCSAECREMARKMQQEEKILKRRIKVRRERKPPNKLDEVLKECDRLGIGYSEWKKQQTLKKVDQIKEVVK